MSAQVHDALPEAEYFASPALSCSGAKLLLPPNCPALYKWQRDNPPEHKQAFDVGHAAHARILGVGAPIAVGAFPDYRSKLAQQWRDKVREDGETPLLASEWEQVNAMTKAIYDHPVASALFAIGGKPEVSLLWHDEQHGIDKRARLDCLRPTVNGRAVAVDLKTCASADPSAIGKAVASYGYDMQAHHYSEGVRACGLADDVVFLFVFVEKTPPHLITVCELDSEALRRGQVRMDRASEMFADCLATDTWPGHSSDIELIRLPRWATYDMENA